MHRKLIRKILAAVFCTSLSLWLSSCADRTVQWNNQSTLVASSGLQVGVKTSEQITMSMSALTGVPALTGNVKTAYDNLKDQLPSSSDAASFQPSHQIAITKLATEYCNSMIDNQTLRDDVIKSIDFSKQPSKAYASATSKTAFITQLTDRFWGKGLTLLPSQTELASTLGTLLNDLIAGTPDNTTGTKNIAKGLCTAVLASSPVTLL